MFPHLGLLQDLPHGARLAVAEQDDGRAGLSSATRAATAVQESLRVLRHIVVQDQLHRGDVEATGSDVCCDEH